MNATDHLKRILLTILVCGSYWSALSQPSQKPYNVVFILSDDHRYDFMGFMDKVPGLETPHMDRMAREGAHLQNAFVTTSLCSPSRASILTGQYAHTHTIVDNNAPLPEGLTFFPQYMQEKGYKTGFFGKWHMGNEGSGVQPGFDEWVSFRGQGVYYSPTFNINGKEVKQPEGSYTTDLLTDYALEWLSSLDDEQPFFVYLSHKGVHSEFQPAERHRGQYDDMPIMCPPSMYLTATDSSKRVGIETEYDDPVNLDGIPEWVRKQRYSWHGVDYMYDGQISFENFYRQYNETLLSVDESIGNVMAWLEKNGLAENTLVIYMGDNGFLFGEHGLIDKRNAYEASIRVPLLAWNPKLIKPQTQIPEMVMNVDIAPTILELTGIEKPQQMQGESFLSLLQGKPVANWRERIFYEYYWEWAFPQTPTIFSVRSDRYKYIFNQGLWDTNELYDLENDSEEMNNLIKDPNMQKIAGQLKKELWDWLDETDGMQIPLKKIYQKRIDHLYRGTY
ncbi:sulfatase family protein [Parapedobacter tibetensis]|uniref:sulfatase family protein n=1 Tax=Parapedobacter tibetensis TaxID=2972951 RepID=UPI00214D6AD5|nr:sulfatase [Parapedobacter tibetensis]